MGKSKRGSAAYIMRGAHEHPSPAPKSPKKRASLELRGERVQDHRERLGGPPQLLAHDGEDLDLRQGEGGVRGCAGREQAREEGGDRTRSDCGDSRAAMSETARSGGALTFVHAERIGHGVGVKNACSAIATGALPSGEAGAVGPSLGRALDRQLVRELVGEE